MSATTQNGRVLAALRERGARGLTRLDFEQAPIIDGGPPILRVARCIGDLKDAGNGIVRGPDRDGVACYVLTHLARSKPVVENLGDGWVRTFNCRRCDFHYERPCGPVCPTCEQPTRRIVLLNAHPSIVGGGDISLPADATPQGSGVALDGPPPPTTSQDDERTAA